MRIDELQRLGYRIVSNQNGTLRTFAKGDIVSDEIGSVQISTSVKITETNLWKPERSLLSQWWFWMVIGLLSFCISGLLFTAQRKRKGSNRQPH